MKTIMGGLMTSFGSIWMTMIGTCIATTGTIGSVSTGMTGMTTMTGITTTAGMTHLTGMTGHWTGMIGRLTGMAPTTGMTHLTGMSGTSGMTHQTGMSGTLTGMTHLTGLTSRNGIKIMEISWICRIIIHPPMKTKRKTVPRILSYTDFPGRETLRFGHHGKKYAGFMTLEMPTKLINDAYSTPRNSIRF